MTQTTITTQIHQPFDAHGNFATQIAFNDEFVDFSAQFFKFAVIQILDLFGWSDAGYGTDILCARTSNTINSRQANDNVFCPKLTLINLVFVYDVLQCK